MSVRECRAAAQASFSSVFSRGKSSVEPSDVAFCALVMHFDVLLARHVYQTMVGGTES
jgi:hypothetical protein